MDRHSQRQFRAMVLAAAVAGLPAPAAAVEPAATIVLHVINQAGVPADVELARQALQQGAADFVTKPFSIRSLSIIVERNLERRRLERERILH